MSGECAALTPFSRDFLFKKNLLARQKCQASVHRKGRRSRSIKFNTTEQFGFHGKSKQINGTWITCTKN
jgi:hypothetical protein